MLDTATRVRFPVARYCSIQRAAVRVLRGDQAAKAELAKMGVAWQTYVSDPQTWEIKHEGAESDFMKALSILAIGYDRSAICYNAAMHFMVNSEHIAPLPVMVLAFILADHVYLQGRDLGSGLGQYLDNIGWAYSTRTEERRRLFFLEDQRSGILLTINQALNGCQGRVVIESSGQRVELGIEGKMIWGKRQKGLETLGTSISLILPLNETWTQETSGSDPYEIPGILPINWQVIKESEGTA